MKDIILIGSTGSIGTQALEVIRENPDDFHVVGLGCGRNIELLRKQIEEFRPLAVSVLREEDAVELARDFPKIEFYWGDKGLCQLAEVEAHMLVNGIMGMRGLEPTYRAISRGTDIALANKETIVTGGSLVMEKAREMGVKIWPVDSEHSAIYQSMMSSPCQRIKRIILTGSGGPFRGKKLEDLAEVTLEQALKHPNWSMGKKITIDSATLMNKGLELIEARWLFDIKPSDIEVLIHPQSILHSAVEFEDGGIVGQMGEPDMKLPIGYAIGEGHRYKNLSKRIDFTELGSLTFEKPDYETFGMLRMAREAVELGPAHTIALNAVNEALVQDFIDEKIRFLDIQRGAEKVMSAFVGRNISTVEDVYALDREIRERVREL